jgi:hypothetical protein
MNFPYIWNALDIDAQKTFLAISLYIRYNIKKFGIDRLREHSLPLNNNFA